MSLRKRFAAVAVAAALVGGAVFLWRRSMREPEPLPGRYTLQWGPGQRRWVTDTATGEMWHECGYDDFDGTKWCAELSARESYDLARLLEHHRINKKAEFEARERLAPDAGLTPP